jgi:hypothetical protein
MREPSDGPGAALVLLRRLDTTTDVWILPSRGEGATLPCAAPRSDASQLDLVEELIQDSRVGRVGRLYGSALSIPGERGPLGVFVGFVGAPSEAAGGGTWMDLREACQGMAPTWASTLSDVRERFIARSPDEALRIR